MIDWKIEIINRLASLNLDPAREQEIVDELAQHLEDRYEELLTGGATEATARSETLSELSESELLARELKRVEPPMRREPVVLGTRRKHMIEDLWQDLRFGARSLRRNPGFTAIALVTLALGIGANTAIFSVINAVLIRPLNYPNPDRLMFVDGISLQGGEGRTPLCAADFLDWKAQNHAFENIAGFSTNRFNYSGGETPQEIDGAWVTADFFSVVGVHPSLGRTFQSIDDAAGSPQTVVVSNEFWRRYLGSDPNILDQQLTLNARAFTIIGVMPPGFLFPERETELWAIDRLAPKRRGPYYMWGLGRLGSGVTPDQARSEMDVIAR